MVQAAITAYMRPSDTGRVYMALYGASFQTQRTLLCGFNVRVIQKSGGGGCGVPLRILSLEALEDPAASRPTISTEPTLRTYLQ